MSVLFDLEDDPSEIEPSTLWLFDKRDNSSGQTGWYHGNTPPQAVAQCLLRYTQPGDVVIDPFFGSGTTGFESLRRGRFVIGVELQPNLADQVRRELTDTYPNKQDQFLIIQGDCTDPAVVETARNQLRTWSRECSLLFLHPPYHNIIQFSDDPRCLSTCPDLETFLNAWRTVLQRWTPLVKPKGGVAVVIGDIKPPGQDFIPLGFLLMHVAMQQPDLKLRAICVKNIRDNTARRGKNGLWNYLAREQNLFVFEHEYVLLFDKL